MKRLLLTLVLVLGYFQVANASLIDKGGGLIYDNVLDITWLQDANYAKTSGYDADGKMTWSEAVTWASNLVYQGYDDWRLPVNVPLDGSTWNYVQKSDGTSDFGTQITSTKSEMAYMYYVNDAKNSPFFASSLQTVTGRAYYWAGTLPTPHYWKVDFSSGMQEPVMTTDPQINFAWAVRSGDSTGSSNPVPEPASMLLLGAGLFGLAGLRKRFRNR